jgi:hypothetical protein
VILKRCIVPTGEPCNTETVPHGSVGGRGKRRISDLARGLPNLRSRFRQQVSASVRLQKHRGFAKKICQIRSTILPTGNLPLLPKHVPVRTKP